MEGNPICVQIPWDKNPQALAKWASVSKISVLFNSFKSNQDFNHFIKITSYK